MDDDQVTLKNTDLSQISRQKNSLSFLFFSGNYKLYSPLQWGEFQPVIYNMWVNYVCICESVYVFVPIYIVIHTQNTGNVQ